MAVLLLQQHLKTGGETMKKILSTELLLVFCGLTFSQGAFLQKGTSGFEASATATGMNDSSYRGQTRLGYSSFGLVDFGFSVGAGKTRQIKNDIGPGTNFMSIRPDLAVFLVKQDSRIPISLALNGSAEMDDYYSNYLSQNYLRQYGNIYSLGATAYRNFSLNDKVKLISSVAGQYNWERTVLRDSERRWGMRDFNAIVSVEDNDYSRVTLGIDAFFKQPDEGWFRLGAAAGYDRSLDKNNFSGALTIGMEIPWKSTGEWWHHPRRYIVVPANETVEYAPADSLKSLPVADDVIIVNIPSVEGGYVPVKLIKFKNGYLGAQGEFYPGRPTVEQLKVLYGN